MERRILWIEDDYFHIGGMMRPLEKAGFSVDVAHSAAEAFEKAKKWEAYDLIVLDLILPITRSAEAVPDEVKLWSMEPYSGIGLLKWLRLELKASCPILVLSVVGEPLSGYGLENVQLNGYILKRGILPSQLRDEVLRVLGLG